MLRIGALGFGRRARTVLEQLEAMDKDVRFVAAWDAAPAYSREVVAITKIREKPEDVRYYDTPEKMLDTEELDGILIGTRCSLHTPMAIKAAARGLPLFPRCRPRRWP